MSLHPLNALLACLGRDRKLTKPYGSESPFEPKYTDVEPNDETEAAAQRFVEVLLKAETMDSNDPQLGAALKESIGTCSWSEWLATRILAVLEEALRKGIYVGKAIKDAAAKSVKAAVSFAKDHPVYFTLIALGVLALLAPLVLEWLGFAEIGIIRGSWAALWQARYLGYVPKGSLFSFFQRLGMTWHWG